MPTFKPKNLKKIVISKKNITTLDSKHKEIIENIDNLKKEELPRLINERSEIKKTLKKGNPTIDEELNMKDKIKLLNK